MFRTPREIAGLWRQDRRALLHELVLLITAAGFVIAPEPVWANFTYALLVPLAIYIAWTRARNFSWRAVPPPLRLAVLLMLWFTVTLFWDAKINAGGHGTPIYWLRNIICTLAFVLSLGDALAFEPGFRERLMRVLIAAGMINAVIAFIRLPFFLPETTASGDLRMAGWAETRHPILGAIIMGVVVLMALYCAVRGGGWRYWLAAATGTVFIALTGSRGPEIALVTGAAILLGWTRPRIFAGIVLTMLIAVSFLAIADSTLLHRLVEAQLARGDSNRFVIWQSAWHDIRRSLLFGHGPNYHVICPPGDCSFAPDGTFPHDLYLSTWLYTGLIGLVLLCGYLLAVLRCAAGATERPMRVFNLALTIQILLCTMTDYSQLIKGPGPMWYIFWLPTLFAALAIKRG